MTCMFCDTALEKSRSKIGICSDCFNDYILNDEHLLKDFIDRIQFPVFVVSSITTKIESANNLFLQTLEENYSNIKGKLPGEVFHCRYSNEPKGCGQTEFCSECEIRNAVLKTINEKKNQEHILVNQEFIDDDTQEIYPISFDVSIKLKEPLVFIQINSIIVD